LTRPLWTWRASGGSGVLRLPESGRGKKIKQMSNDTFLIIAGLSTAFIAIATYGFGFAAHYWRCVARELETKNKNLARAMFYKNLSLFVVMAVRLVLTLYAWNIGAVDIDNTTAGAAWRGLITWALATIPAVISFGVCRGWFLIEVKKDEIRDIQEQG
jgi:hypothetical protein